MFDGMLLQAARMLSKRGDVEMPCALLFPLIHIFTSQLPDPPQLKPLLLLCGVVSLASS